LKYPPSAYWIQGRLDAVEKNISLDEGNQNKFLRLSAPNLVTILTEIPHFPLQNIIHPLSVGLHCVVLNQLSTGAISPYLILPSASSFCIVVLQRIALEIFYYFLMIFLNKVVSSPVTDPS
jgi:hypothetical protein